MTFNVDDGQSTMKIHHKGEDLLDTNPENLCRVDVKDGNRVKAFLGSGASPAKSDRADVQYIKAPR